jgi:short-subunit dehydrogenase
VRLAGRNIWLIGASSGIGAALVPCLTGEGARLAISARGVDDLERIARANEAPGRPIIVKGLDVTEKGLAERVAAEIRDALGSIDVLIYSAGDWDPVDVTKWDTESVERQIAVNYVGFVRAVGAVLPDMVRRRSGDIVGIASVSGYAGFPRAEAYGSTKAALISLLQSLRIDLKRHGVGVTTVSPGFVDTPLTRKNDFRMPFLITSQEAAERITQGLLDGQREVHFPKRLSLSLKLLTALPGPVFERLAGMFMARGG